MDSGDLRAFGRLTRAWLLGMARDRSTVFFMFVMPILFVVIFGFAFGRSDVGSYNVGVAVDESTPAGSALTRAINNVKPFKVSSGSADALLKKLRDGDLYALVSSAPAPAASAAPASATTLTVYYDPSRTAAQQIVLPIIHQVVGNVDRELSGRPLTLTVDDQSVRSQNLRYIDFFLPGIIGFSIMQSGMFAAIPFVQLRVSRVLKRFRATPVSRLAVLSSQSVARVLLAVIQTTVLLVVGKLLFNLRLDANWPMVVALVLLGAVVFLGLGFAVSGLARTEEAVPPLVQVVSFPMMFLAGVFFPVENFPGPIQAVSKVLPLTFLGDGLRQTMVHGAPLNPLWLDVGALLVWLAVSAALAVRLFRWE